MKIGSLEVPAGRKLGDMQTRGVGYMGICFVCGAVVLLSSAAVFLVIARTPGDVGWSAADHRAEVSSLYSSADERGATRSQGSQRAPPDLRDLSGTPFVPELKPFFWN